MEGFMFKQKVKAETTDEKTGKTKTVSRIEFFLNIGGAVFAAPDNISSKLISAMGVKKAFGGKLRFECSPYDLKFDQSGIPAAVESIADYGAEKFAVCNIGGNIA